jgi:hypothetical protein
MLKSSNSETACFHNLEANEPTTLTNHLVYSQNEMNHRPSYNVDFLDVDFFKKNKNINFLFLSIPLNSHLSKAYVECNKISSM